MKKAILFAMLLSACNPITAPLTDGLVIALDCSEPIDTVTFITENDITYVDWEKQIYYLKTDSLAGWLTCVYDNRVCYGACYIRVFIDKKQQYRLPIVSAMAPIGVKRGKKEPSLFCPCDTLLPCLFDDNALKLLQTNLPFSVEPLLYNEKIRLHLQEVGKLR